MVTFLGKIIIFRGKFITFMCQLSLYFSLCTLYQIHQKNLGMGQTLPLSGNARILEAPVAETPLLEFENSWVEFVCPLRPRNIQH